MSKKNSFDNLMREATKAPKRKKQEQQEISVSTMPPSRQGKKIFLFGLSLM